MSEALDGFTVEEGDVITITAGALDYFAGSESKEDNSETPVVARLQATKEKSKYIFATSKTDKGRILFLPEGLKEGDKVKIVWSDSNCSCAHKV